MSKVIINLPDEVQSSADFMGAFGKMSPKLVSMLSSGMPITVSTLYALIKEMCLEDALFKLLFEDRMLALTTTRDDLAEATATLRLIGKVTKDKTVKDILRDD